MGLASSYHKILQWARQETVSMSTQKPKLIVGDSKSHETRRQQASRDAKKAMGSLKQDKGQISTAIPGYDSVSDTILNTVWYIKYCVELTFY